MRAIELGSSYLARHYAKTNDPLEMAIVTHTLLVAGENSASQQAMFRLRSMKRTGISMRDSHKRTVFYTSSSNHKNMDGRINNTLCLSGRDGCVTPYVYNREMVV